MDGILVLAVIWGLVSVFSSTAKKYKKAQEKSRSQAEAAPRPERKLSEAMSPVWQQVTDMMREQLSFEGSAPDEMDDEPHLTAPRLDEAGCVGGSIAHDSHEGDGWRGSLAGPEPMPVSRHEEAQMAPQAEFQVVRRRRSVSARRMREAVIMSEVLGRPLTMRDR